MQHEPVTLPNPGPDRCEAARPAGVRVARTWAEKRVRVAFRLFYPHVAGLNAPVKPNLAGLPNLPGQPKKLGVGDDPASWAALAARVHRWGR